MNPIQEAVDKVLAAAQEAASKADANPYMVHVDANIADKFTVRMSAIGVAKLAAMRAENHRRFAEDPIGAALSVGPLVANLVEGAKHLLGA